jgi:hypothetical protein
VPHPQGWHNPPVCSSTSWLAERAWMSPLENSVWGTTSSCPSTLPARAVLGHPSYHCPPRLCPAFLWHYFVSCLRITNPKDNSIAEHHFMHPNLAFSLLPISTCIKKLLKTHCPYSKSLWNACGVSGAVLGTGLGRGETVTGVGSSQGS